MSQPDEGTPDRDQVRQLEFDFSSRAALARQLAALALSEAEVRVLLYIWECGLMRDNRSAVRVSVRKLAKAIGYSRSHIAGVLADLEEDGVVAVARGQPNSYLIDWSQLRASTRPARGGAQPRQSDPFGPFEVSGPVSADVSSDVSAVQSAGVSGRVSGGTSPLLSESGSEASGEERVTDRKNELQTHSLTPSVSSRERVGVLVSRVRDHLPTLPLELWTVESEHAVRRLVDEWCLSLIDREAGETFDGDLRRDILGAVLAARHTQADCPDRFVATCLVNGVKARWKAKAQSLLPGGSSS